MSLANLLSRYVMEPILYYYPIIKRSIFFLCESKRAGILFTLCSDQCTIYKAYYIWLGVYAFFDLLSLKYSAHAPIKM